MTELEKLKQDIEHLRATLDDMGRTVRHTNQVARQAAVLAMGTRDVTRDAAHVVAVDAHGLVQQEPKRSDLQVPARADGEPDTQDLLDRVYDLCKERPRTFRELVEITGARDNRVAGVTTRLAVRGLVNVGSNVKALWWVPNDQALERLRKMPRRRG